MIDSGLRVVADVQADVGEGPSWDSVAGVLRFVDVTAGLIYRYSPADRSLLSINVGQEIGAVIPREGGGIVVAVRAGIAAVDERTGQLEVFAAIEGDLPSNRMNDAKCDPAGRLWAGTMAFDLAAGAGALYRLETDGGYTMVLDHVTVSNGLGWSPDGEFMYYIDSADGSVDVLDYDLRTGAASNRRRLITVAPADGVPDGMAIDAEGHLWVALFGSGFVERYTPSGAVVDRIDLPVKQVTSVAFGGPRLDDLYITSAAYNLTPEQLQEQPLAGATFVCNPGVAGQPVASFHG